MALFANIGLLAIIELFIIGLPAIIGLLVIMLLPIVELPPAPPVTPNSSGPKANDDLNGELDMERAANGGTGTPGKLDIDPDGEDKFEWKWGDECECENPDPEGDGNGAKLGKVEGAEDGRPGMEGEAGKPEKEAADS